MYLVKNNFNPHHRKGGDFVLRDNSGMTPISIHTTAKVVTENDHPKDAQILISIHTTAKVVTKQKGEGTAQTEISIHTTAKVVTKS